MTVSVLLLQAIAALVGTVAFAVLYSVPRTYYVTCGICGIVGWLLYCLMDYCGIPSAYATFLATVVVVLLSRFCAVWKKCPATVFMITGVFPLIPGAGFYWTAYYLVVGESTLAASTGIAALKVVFGLVLGIVCVLELPNRFFLPRNLQK